MVKGEMTLNIMCNECCFLDKSRKQESSILFQLKVCKKMKSAQLKEFIRNNIVTMTFIQDRTKGEGGSDRKV